MIIKINRSVVKTTFIINFPVIELQNVLSHLNQVPVIDIEISKSFE